MIPRVFHQIWIGPDPIPDAFKRYQDTWIQLHPTWLFLLHTEFNLVSQYPSIVADCREYRHIANIYRYELMARMGGVYIDIDFECRKNIEPLLDGRSFVAAPQRDNPSAPDWLNNAFFACEPEHSVARELEARIPEAYADRHLHNIGYSHYGPTFFTRIVRNGVDVTIIPRRSMYPYASGESPPAAYPPDTFAVHHWASTTQLRGPGILKW